MVDMEDEEQDRLMTRSNSWSHTQRPSFLDTNQSMGRTTRPINGLSCIYETDDNGGSQETDFMDSQRNRSKSMTNGTAGQAQVKKRRHSYTELIASAILSSPEKRKTLAEIYDWFVLNVPSFKDQRYMHSSLGWKNAVRHNLSVQTCFKRVKRHGMEKPSWWTVDMNEVAKRRLVLRPTVTNNNAEGDDESFLPPRRNTYSGPNPQNASKTEVNASHNQLAYRVASTNDISSVTNAHYITSNKRSHYAPIRPAMPTQSSDMIMFDLGDNGYSSTECDYGDANGVNNIDTNNLDDCVFLKPCAIDTSSSIDSKPYRGQNFIPSVTLVCKESPTSNQPYRQAQLEVSFQTGDNGHMGPTSPGAYTNWTSSNSSCCQNSPNHPNHFNTWPNIAESLNLANHVDSGNSTATPNQTLRVKTIWGNVEDINFNGLLPMRTVVKCDGGTQTEQVSDRKDLINLSKSNWNQASFHRYQRAHNLIDHEAALPEDLAGLQIEGDIQCDIDEVLGASLDVPNTKPMWGWSCNSAYDRVPYVDHMDDSPLLNVASFNTAKVDMSEM